MYSSCSEGETFYYIDHLKNQLKENIFEHKYRRLVRFLETMNQTIQFANLLIDNKERSGLNDKIKTLREGNKTLVETISGERLKDKILMEISLGTIEDINQTLERNEDLNNDKKPKKFISYFVSHNIISLKNDKKNINSQLNFKNYNIINDEIFKLKKELNDEKNKNMKNEKEIAELNRIKSNLENELTIEKNKNKELLNKLNMINNNNSLNEEFVKKIEYQNKMINDLKSTKNNDSLICLPGEKILAVIFTSLDQKVHFPLAAKNNELFVFLEIRFYDEYPGYKEKDVFFISNGIKINRFKNMEENNIKTGDSIILNIVE
jgi:hypothetical protein